MEEAKINIKNKLKKTCCSADFVLGFLSGISFASIVMIIVILSFLFFFIANNSKDKPLNSTDNNIQNTQNNAETDTNPLSIASLKKNAVALKLDASKFNNCLDGGKYASKAKGQAQEGKGLGVSGTPATFINGHMVTGAQNISLFKEIIDAILAGKNVNTLESYKTASKGTIPAKVTIDISKDYVRGLKNGKIIIVEYSDFECPYCKKHATTIEQLMKDYDGKIGFVYKHFPLDFHKNAQKAAEATECAGEQGKFWEMHDKLFDI